MTESLDPLAATAEIETAYRRYLRSTMRTNDPKLDTAIAAAFDGMKRPLVQGPILESSPPFRAGRPISALVEAGLLAPDWLRHNFHGQVVTERSLYLHQDEAISRVVEDRRNVVVATGTGSGKTEAFLIPIIETLFRQQAAGRLRPGVRALLLYPMNALANDQLRRLRELLRDVPAITFGRYTGETQETRQRGIAALEAAAGNVTIFSNELLGREEMQATPPHILLTNYAMLEYLLLRPDDSPLFDPTGEDGWKFIVLDEVHTYDGAMGIEMGMLVRRLLNRVRRGPGNIQCILTSATLGGPGDRAAVARFASALTSLPFAWDDDNGREQDVVVAIPEQYPLPPPGPDADLNAIFGSSEASELQASALAADPRIQRFLGRLWEGPASIEDVIAATSSAGQAVEPATVTRLVQRLSELRVPGTETPFLRARFHTFVRAIDGAEVCLRPHPDGLPRVFLEPQRHCPDCGNQAVVAELATCRRCAQWHLRGIVPDDHLERAPDREDSDEEVCYVAPRADADFNEDRGAGEDEAETGLFGKGETDDRQVSFCLNCLSMGNGQDCCPNPLKQPFVLASRTKGGAIRCVSCGAPATQSGPRRLRLGTDAPPAVVASALYDAMPPGVGSKRPRFLSFADSRQDAAFFAPYLERTYSSVARRRVLYEAIEATWSQIEEDEGVRPNDIVAPVRRLADSQLFFDPSESTLAQSNKVRAWILSELTSINRRQSLAGVGLVSRRLVRPPNWEAPSPLLQPPWSLSPDEAWQVIETLLKTLLDDQAIAFPDGVDLSNEIFSPRNKELGFRQLERARDSGIEIMPWAPARGANARSDYLDRLLQRLQEGWSKETRRATVESVLEGLWRLISKRDGPLSGYLSQTNHPRHGPYFQLSPDFWEFARPRELVACDTCGLMEYAAVRGVCLSYRCIGRMRAISEPLSESHYLELYLEPGRGALVAQEHTAQWSALEAARIQGEFVRDNGSVNVLSCSTTFELGVDVGDLQSVLLRNVPPTAANYVQRAGRAGRRDETVGFIVTFAQLRPHDTQAFDDVKTLVAGVVPAPRIPASNARIVRRHVHSMALSRFLRHLVASGQGWPRRVGPFFVASEPDQKTPCESFRDFLAGQDAQLGEEVAQVVSTDLHSELGLETWEWAAKLADLDPTESPLALAECQIQADVQAYNELLDVAWKEKRGAEMDRYRRVLNTVQQADLIGSLAGSNVLPKYGFPVDVVPLKTAHLKTPEAKSVQLDRDLRIAVSEFAPGSGVVAAKKLWISGGVQLFPNRALPERDYAICRSCNRYYEGAGVTSCTQCGQRLDSGRGNSRGKLVNPKFGFVARDPDVRPLGEERPRRLYSTRVLFQDYGKPSAREPMGSGSNTILGRFMRTGRLAVVNTGRDRHFQLCHTCGFARPRGASVREHRHPVSGRACSGTLVVVDLGHSFTSDIAEFEFPALGPVDERRRASLLAALLEGARRLLAVSSDDLAALCYFDGSVPVFAIYDNVPGGAGLAREVHARIGAVLDAAQRLCDECQCGDNSSCYGCLRSYRNQYEHELLDRTLASQALAGIREGRRPAVDP